MNEIKEVKSLKDACEVQFSDNKIIRFEHLWLRDNCRCPQCYRSATYQRAHDILDIPDVGILEVTHDRKQMSVKWQDNHESVYKAEFLVQFDYETWKLARRMTPILWHGKEFERKVAKVHINSLKNKAELTRVFQSLLDYGVAFIEGVESNLKATEEVCVAVGGVQHTLFGGMWEFTTKATHADTAYTNLPLASHNDNTYFTEAAGLQILHCVKHSNGTGGLTTLVDGFYGAECLKNDHNEDYKFLTKFNLDAEYIEDGHHHKHSAPVIRIDDETKDIKQIRFNTYDRAPMAFKNTEECRAYYRSLRNLAQYYYDPKNIWEFKLTPGLVVIIDNFRVLHGRTAFTGTRVMCGSYVARSNWLDKARYLDLIQ